MKRRHALGLAGALALPSLDAWAVDNKLDTGADGKKTLRVVFPVAETGFDPPRLTDIYSRTVTAHIFDAPYDFDHLARPVKLRPRVSVGLPEHADDFKTWTVRIRPGIYFAPDEAFKGQKRELVAQDFVYSYKRFADPATNSAAWGSFEELELLGLLALRDKALKDKAPFNYDSVIDGLRTTDRYTLQFKVAKSNPRFAEQLSDYGLLGAVAREVVEFYGDKIMEHPVGTGPYRLAQWRRSSQIVLERNPHFREELWDADPATDDAEGQAMLKRLRGKRLPLIDRIEIAIIEEAQPRWLSFMNTQIDVLRVPQEFVPIATPGGKLAPNLKKKGIQSWRVLIPYTQITYYNMDDPAVGGLSPGKVALRRALGLAMNLEREIRLVFRGQAIVAQSIIAPYTSGYDSAFRSENSEYNPSRAKALLDTFGYVDTDGDGWREQPDGQPLILECATQADGLSRERDEFLKKDLDAIGIRITFKTAQWPENLKAARAGKLMIWRLGTSSSVTDGQEVLQRLYGPQIDQGNLARFKLPAFDAVYDQMLALPDGPERLALFDKAKRMAIAYAPYKVHLHQYADIVAQPWLDGFRLPIFWQHWWHMADIDMARRKQGI
jgi:ABC-type transport system substrate-binding protein